MIRLVVLFITCFVLDNLLVIFLPIQPMFGQYMAIPCIFLISLCFFTFYDKSYRAIMIAVIFGILYDVCYADLIGLYTCLFPIITILVQRFIAGTMPVNILSMLGLMSVIIIFEQWVVYFLVNTMMITNMNTYFFIKLILIPTVLFNAVALIPLYPILKNQFQNYQRHLEHL